jgi:diguanylate cyclase (GGDEF)-like protein
MYTFTQLLIRNAILGLVFSSAMLLLSAFFLSQTLVNKQQQQINVIQNIATQNFLDVADLVKAIRSSNRFNLLNVDTIKGDSLYHFTDQSPSMVLPSITPKPTKIILNDKNLRILFQLNHSDELRLVLNIFIAFFISTLLFSAIAAYISINRYNTFFSNMKLRIKEQLMDFAEHGKATNGNFDSQEMIEVTEAINEIQQLFEQQKQSTVALEQQAYVDSLTQLNNRGRFVQYFENKVQKSEEVKFGVLLITRCSELQTINQIRGYNEGDRYICSVADIMKSVINSYQGAEMFRLNSSDFATILPNTLIAEGENVAKQLTAKFNDYQQSSDLDSVAYTGLVSFDVKSPLGELLALADTGISVAQTQHLNSWFVQKDSEILRSASASYGNQNWRQEIDNVIENQRVSLLVQPIHPNSRTSKVYGEILARFLNSKDEMLPTASFIAMAEKLDKIVAIDRLIIESAINELIHKNITEQSIGINISARSIHDSHFVIWLERKLLREAQVASRLVFEITEYGLQQNIKSSKRFIDMIHRAGARLTVERFGVGLTSFKFFRDLKPDFIKMDSTYTRDIDEDKNNQYFLRLMVDLAHRLSINVLAESVETLEEKHTLEKLFIDGCQGYYIGKPEPL